MKIINTSTKTGYVKIKGKNYRKNYILLESTGANKFKCSKIKTLISSYQIKMEYSQTK